MTIRVKRSTTGTWGVYVDDHLVDGGFFTRKTALYSAQLWAKELAFTGIVTIVE